jgi:hypothetical protein
MLGESQPWCVRCRADESHLFRKLPHELHTAEHVAAPQHEAANPKIWLMSVPGGAFGFGLTLLHTVPALGTASKGSERRAPISNASLIR